MTANPNHSQPLPDSHEALSKAASSQEAISYDKQLKQNFMEVIKSLELQDRQKLFLEHRWLDQVLWMEGKSNRCRNQHTRLRLMAILFGVITPILVGANTFLPENKNSQLWLKLSALVVSSVVAITSSTDEFFNYGKRWYSYRRSVESLKSEGWQFFNLTGSYLAHKTHADAFSAFVSQVEETIRQDVELFSTQQPKSKEDVAKTDTQPV